MTVTEAIDFLGWQSKKFKIKARKIPRNAAYLAVREIPRDAAQHRYWTFYEAINSKKNIRIVISSGSEFCHFERQREIFNKQDSSSLLLLGMTTAKASKIILNILEFLRSQPGGGVGDA